MPDDQPSGDIGTGGVAEDRNTSAEPTLSAYETFESALSSPASPAEPPAPASPSAEAATPPLTDAVPETLPAGPIPLDRHQAILTKAREDAKRELDTLRQQYDWASGLDATQGRQVMDLVRQLVADPYSFYERLGQDLQQSPQYTQQMRSYAARVLSQAKAAHDAMPEPDLQTESGKLVYSAEQQSKWLEWNRRQWDAQVAEQLQPVQQFMQTVKDEQERNAIVQQSYQTAKGELDQGHTWYGFNEHKAEIRQYLLDHPEVTSLPQAYLAVLHSTILPKLTATEQARVISSMQQKATASTISPKSGGTTVQGAPKSMAESLERAMARAGSR